MKNNRGAGDPVRTALSHSVPIIVGITPFAVAYALLGLSVGLSPGELIAMSMLVFAGASQMVAVTMLQEPSVPVALIVVTTALINLRHLLMGVSMAPHLRGASRGLQAAAAFFMIDESYALAMNRMQRFGFNVRYYFTCGAVFFSGWSLLTGVGIVFGRFIADPFALPLDFIMPATFLVLVMPFLTDWPNILAAAAAALTAILGALFLPGHWYIVIAAVIAAAVGAAAEGVMTRGTVEIGTEGANNAR